MRSFVALSAIVCGTIIACHGVPLWSAPCWCLAAFGLVQRRT